MYRPQGVTPQGQDQGIGPGGEGEQGTDQYRRRWCPGREGYANGGEQRALENEGTRDVAKGEGIFFAPNPENAIDFFRQFGGDRHDQQRQQQGGNAEELGQVLYSVHEKFGPVDDAREPETELQQDDQQPIGQTQAS